MRSELQEVWCHTDEPMETGKVLRDFLPAPEALVFKDDSVKVTISLSTKSVDFFKAEAARSGVQYQRMIRRLLDAYVAAFEVNRVDEARAPFRKAGKPRKAR